MPRWPVLLAHALALAALPSPCLGSEPPTAVRLTRDSGFKQHLSWSPDGKRLVLTRIHQGKMGLWVMDADGSNLKPFLTPTPETPHFDGSFSRDGKKVVFVLDILQGTEGKLWINVANSDGSDSQVLIPNKALEEAPRLSPDGKRLIWVSTRDGNQEIYTATSDGKDIRRLTSEVAPDNGPSWSPDSKRIAFASARSGNFEIHVMDADGGNVRRLTNHPALDYWPSWSPDGKRIAFISTRDGGHDVYVQEVAEQR
jgi:TolB protein